MQCKSRRRRADSLRSLDRRRFAAAELRRPGCQADLRSSSICRSRGKPDDGETVTLVDMPKDVEITHSYAIPSDPGQTATILKKVRDNLPDAKIESSPGKLVVHGLAEDQDFVDTLLSGKTARKVTVGEGKKGLYALDRDAVWKVDQSAWAEAPGFNVKIDDAAIESCRVAR